MSSTYWISTKRLPYVGAIVLALWACGPLGADDSTLAVPWPDKAHDPSVLPWGRPLQDGPIDVFAVVPVFGQTDLAGLAARLDLNVSVLPVWGRETWANEDDPEGTQRINEGLRAALSNRQELLLFANVVLDPLDGATVDLVRQRVEQGTGVLLVTVGVSPDSSFAGLLDSTLRDDDATAELRAFAETLGRTPERLEVYTLGSGRLCLLNWGPPPACQSVLPRVQDAGFITLEARESDYAVIAECAIWAARRRASQQIVSVSIPGWQAPIAEDLPPDLSQDEREAMVASVFVPPTQTVHVKLAQPATARDRLRLGVRAPEHKTRITFEGEALPRETQAFAIEVPALPHSGYIDAWLEQGGATIDWYTAPFTSPGPSPLALRLHQDAVPAHAGLGVSIEKRGASVQGVRAAALRVTDALGRVVGQEVATWPREGSLLQGELSLYDLLAPQVTVEAFILPVATRDPQVWTLLSVPQASQRVAVRAPRREQGFAMAARGLLTSEYVPRQHHETLRRHGATALLVEPGELDPAYIAGSGLAPLLEITPKFLGEQLDPIARVEAARERLAAAFLSAKRYGPTDAVLALTPEDASLEAIRGDAAWLRAFRAYLRSAYVNLEALNAAWGAGFATWDVVAPPAFEFEGAGGASFAPWLDTRLFARQRELEAAVAVRKVLAEVDDEGRAGLATELAPPAGFDLVTAASALDLLFLPPELWTIERFSAGAGPNAAGLIAFQQSEGNVDPGWLCWYAVLNGLSGVWMPYPYATVTPKAAPFALSAGGLPTTKLLALADTARRMRDGTGELYQRATPAAARIALYDSPASAVLEALNPVFSGDGASMDVWIESLRALRLPFEVINSRRVVGGGLDTYQAVILPNVRALSATECARLAAFQAGGSMLIAGFLPGQFDEHGVLRQESPLAALFSVTQSGPPVPVKVDDAWALFSQDEALTGIGTVTADASLASRDAVVAEEGPLLWRVTQVQGGATLLLNHGVSPSQAEVLQRGLRAFIERNGGGAGLEQVEVAAGADVWAWQHTFGAARLLTLLRHPMATGRAERVRVAFSEKRQLYAPSDGVMLRGGAGATVRMAPGEASLLVQLPYKLKALRLTVPEEVKLGERLTYAVEVEAEDALPGDHLVHVTARPLGGSVLETYSNTILCPGGKGGGFVPLALNDTAAFYRIEARDVLTGTRAEATLNVIRR